MDAYKKRGSKDDRWGGTLEHIGAAGNKIQTLSEICRFSVRSHLGIGIRHKTDGLIIPNPQNFVRTMRPEEPMFLSLPNKLKDFLMFSEIDDDCVEEQGFMGLDPLR